MAKTSFTNADLTPRRGERGFQEPQDIVGEWRPVVGSASKPADPTLDIDGLIADAQGSLARLAALSEEVNAAGNVAPQPKPLVERVGEVVGPVGELAMLPAAFMSGPIGTAAGATFAAQGVRDFANAPGVVTGGLAALGALPFVKPAMRAAKGLRGVMRGPQPQLNPYVKSTQPSGSVRPAAPQEPLPISRTGAGTIERADRSTVDVLPESVGRFTPNTPGPVSAGDNAAAALPFETGVGRYVPNIPGTITAGDDAARAAVDEGSVAALVDRYLPNTSSPVSKGSDIAVAARNTRKGKRSLDSMTDDFVREYRQRKQHGVGGFSNLPELSAAELARISAAIDRITR